MTDPGANDDRRDAVPAAASAQSTSPSLLWRARANDADAWRRLVELYRPLVLCWCGGVPPADVEDVAQDVFVAAATGLAGFRRDRPGDTFRGWLRVVTRNAVNGYFRRARNAPQAAGGSDAWHALQAVADPSPVAEEEAAESGQLYRRALELVRGEFEERTWHAFWLTAVEGQLTAAVADELGVTPAAIRQSRSRVLRRLKEELGDVID